MADESGKKPEYTEIGKIKIGGISLLGGEALGEGEEYTSWNNETTGKWLLKDEDGNVVKEFDNAAALHKYIPSLPGYAEHMEDMSGFFSGSPEKKIAFLNQMESLVGKQGTSSLGGKDPGFNTLKQNLKAAADAQAQQIAEAITGFGAQCFLMEHIEQFVHFAAGAPNITSSDQALELPPHSTPGTTAATTGPPNTGAELQQAQAGSAGLKAGGYGSKHIRLLSMDKPELVHNALMSDTRDPSNLEAFQRGTPAMYSALVPQIRIFKVFRDGEEVQIPFSTHIGSRHDDITKMLEDRKGRADDVGILGFDFEYEQGNIALSTNARTAYAELSLLFESADAFTAKRNLKTASGARRPFTFEDLITEGGNSPGAAETKSADEYRIRVALGYGVPAGTEDAFEEDEKGSVKHFFKAARKIKTSLFLDTISYDLEFMETGQMSMTFKYAASLEESLDYPEFNVFGNELAALKKELEDRKKKRKEKYGEAKSKDLEKQKKDTKEPEDIEIEKLEETHAIEFNKLYSKFKKTLLKNVYKIGLTDGEIQRYCASRGSSKSKTVRDAVSTGFIWSPTENVSTSKMEYAQISQYSEVQEAKMLNDFANANAVEAKEKAKNADPKPSAAPTALQQASMNASTTQGLRYLYWTYFGDVLAALLSIPHIAEEMNRKNIDIILGQVFVSTGYGEATWDAANDEVAQPKPKLVSVNIGDIPISLDLLNQTFVDGVVKQKKSNMSLLRMIKLLLANVVQPTLNSRCKTDQTLKNRTTQLAATFYTGAGNTDTLLGQHGRVQFSGNDFKPLFMQSVSHSGPTTSSDRKDYLIISTHDGGASTYAADEPEDIKMGIMHYGLARDRGLLKGCSFKKNDIPYGREIYMARAKDSQDTQNTSKLWNVYNADVTLFGNPNIKPYFMIYIDPSMPGMGFLTKEGSTARLLKIGGYYRVLKVSNSITTSSWETQIECIYETTAFLAGIPVDPRTIPEFKS